MMKTQCLWDELQAKAARLSLSFDDEGDTKKKKQKDNWLPMVTLASTALSPSTNMKPLTLWQKHWSQLLFRPDDPKHEHCKEPPSCVTPNPESQDMPTLQQKQQQQQS
jgi:hypothetical protein